MNAAPRLDAEADLETTARKRWQLRRDLVIAIARKHGASSELLADVFDLDVSRIKQIVRTTKDRYAPDLEQPRADERRGPRRFVA